MILALLCSDVYCLAMKDFPNKLSEEENIAEAGILFRYILPAHLRYERYGGDR